MNLLFIFASAMSPQPATNVEAQPSPNASELANTVPSKGTGTVAAADAASKKICRTSAPTGSRIPTRKICLTKAEWDRLGDEARSALGREIRTGPNRGI